MKATAPTIAAPEIEVKSGFAVWAELFKARLTGLVVLTALGGFYLGSGRTLDAGRLFHTLAGIGLVACGAAALNQWLEREHDALMPRTRNRPLPSGVLRPETALLAGSFVALLGLVELSLLVNPLTAILAGVTLGLYLLVYTPLKRITTWNTIIGAVPGALPPLMGWTGARGELGPEGVVLFAIQFFWQMPHFLAIAWLYREQYSAAGYVMLPGVDATGERTGRQATSHALALLPASLVPVWLGMAGPVYLVAALVLGVLFAWMSFRFSRELSRESARRMFFASLVYLPLILGLMALDRVTN
jgi:protoheme IX farnesyltransferase